MDFANDFANKLDPVIFEKLGDAVEVTHADYGVATIQAAFTKARDKEALVERVHDYYPSMIVQAVHLHLFEDHSAIVDYNGEQFEVYDTEPHTKLTHKIIFKDA